MEAPVRPRENWFDPEYVRYWLGQQNGRFDERMHQFLMIRSLVPYRSDQSFRALDVGGGDGWLAEVLLSHFSAARVTVLDQSAVMLEQAKQRLSRFGDRADTAQGDLRDPEWRAGLSGTYD
ncbi:MAG TPA: class I SAM-dependent methyltransferase, partial [Chloroflexota bacterium]